MQPQVQPWVQGRIQLSSGSCWCQEAAVGSWCWTLPILANGAGIPLIKVRTLCTPPGYYSHPSAITNWNKLSLPGREEILALEALLSIVWLTSLFQLNSHAHVHQLEDNLAEANAQLAAVEESQAENKAIRLQGKFLDSFVQCYLPRILLFPYISSSSGSPALSPLADLPNPSLSLQSHWISSSLASLCSCCTAKMSQLSWEHQEAQSRLNQTVQ